MITQSRKSLPPENRGHNPFPDLAPLRSFRGSHTLYSSTRVSMGEYPGNPNHGRIKIRDPRRERNENRTETIPKEFPGNFSM